MEAGDVLGFILIAIVGIGIIIALIPFIIEILGAAVGFFILYIGRNYWTKDICIHWKSWTYCLCNHFSHSMQ